MIEALVQPGSTYASQIDQVINVISVVVFFWGVVLAAEQILPRIGYAALPAIWSCGG